MGFAWMSDPSFILLQFLVGLSRGSVFFIAASGLTLTYGVLRIINFAQGSFYMFGAYFAYQFTTTFEGISGNFWLSIILASMGVALLGLLIERTVIHRIYKREHIHQLLLTYALILIFSDLAKMTWGVEFHTMNRPEVLDGVVPIPGGVFPTYYLFLIVAGGLIAIAIWVFLYRTRVGNLIRAAAADSEIASALGIDVRLIFTAVFTIGSLLAGFGGAIAAPVGAVGPGIDVEIVLIMFIVVVVGGLGSVAGALVAAMIIGEVFSFGILVVPQFSMAILFIIMAVTLSLRPFGLFGRSTSH